MYFNPTTQAQSIVARIDRMCGTDVTRYPLIQKANDCNDGLDRFWYLAMTADGTWQMDDANATDLPIATTNIVSGQQDYLLTTDMMIVEKLLAKNATGQWNELYPVDISQMNTRYGANNIWELPAGNTGAPTEYDKKATSIFLNPIPNYNSVGGLKIVFQRGPSYFTDADTIKQPGIPMIFHNYIVRFAAAQYLNDKRLFDKASKIEARMMIDEQAIGDFYSRRTADEQTQIITPYSSSR